MQGILLAMNKQKLIDVFYQQSIIGKENGVLGVVRNNDDIYQAVSRYNPNILLMTDGLEYRNEENRDTIQLLIRIKASFPNLRIIFLAGEIVETDQYGINRLGRLVENKIYDIYHHSSLTKSILCDLIERPRTYEDVKYLLRFHAITGDTNFEFEDYNDSNLVDEGFENIVIMSSIKPGSGKTFISTNVASAVAKWGQTKPNGNPPKVAIIEGDLQTLSVGTLLQLDDRERNLNNALKIASTVVDDDGCMIGTEAEILKARELIRKCFLKSNQLSNLYALVSSQFSLGDLSEINPCAYYFIIDEMRKEFDIIIVDTNSSLEHKTTGALLNLAKTCYYILDLDFNNVANNKRYRGELNNLGVMNKVRYILNKDIPESMEATFAEKLEFNAKNLHTSGFELVAKVPLIDTTVVYNRCKQGTPLVFDKTKPTYAARKELLAVAGEIYPCDGYYMDLLEEAKIYKDEEKGKIFPKSKEKKERKGFFKSRK